MLKRLSDWWHWLWAVTEPKKAHDWFNEYLEADKKLKILRRALGELYPPEAQGKILQLAEYRNKITKLKADVTRQREALEDRNRTLFATGLIVSCTGCRAGAPDNWQDLTEDRVAEVELLAKRLRTWFDNDQWKQAREKKNGAPEGPT